MIDEAYLIFVEESILILVAGHRNVVSKENQQTNKKYSGYFTFHEGKWVLVNQKLTSLVDKTDEKEIPINEMVD